MVDLYFAVLTAEIYEHLMSRCCIITANIRRRFSLVALAAGSFGRGITPVVRRYVAGDRCAVSVIAVMGNQKQVFKEVKANRFPWLVGIWVKYP